MACRKRYPEPGCSGTANAPEIWAVDPTGTGVVQTSENQVSSPGSSWSSSDRMTDQDQPVGMVEKPVLVSDPETTSNSPGTIVSAATVAETHSRSGRFSSVTRTHA